jgi:hypothetical protein
MSLLRKKGIWQRQGASQKNTKKEEISRLLRLTGKNTLKEILLMRRRTFVLATLVVFLTLPFPALETGAFSDRIGVYARVDKVVLEPDATAPERIQIQGAFAIARKDDRDTYEPAQRGYLYFYCKPDQKEICRKEWADLKAIAGTGQIVGFGSRYNKLRSSVRKVEDKAANPDEYPVNFGLVKIGSQHSDYAPIRELKSLPREGN